MRISILLVGLFLVGCGQTPAGNTKEGLCRGLDGMYGASFDIGRGNVTVKETVYQYCLIYSCGGESELREYNPQTGQAMLFTRSIINNKPADCPRDGLTTDCTIIKAGQDLILGCGGTTKVYDFIY
jgi:hypothetical protein